MTYDDDSCPPMTEAELLASIARHYDCEPAVAVALRSYFKAAHAGRIDSPRYPKPGCCHMGHSHLGNKEIQYATLCDYDGLVEVYRIRSDGRAVRLMNWPKWLVELDYDPEWRAYCRQLKLKDERRRRQSRKRMERLVEKLRPVAPTPVAPAAPVAAGVEEGEFEKAMRLFREKMAVMAAAKAAAAAVAPAAPAALTIASFMGDIDMADLEKTLAELDGL